MKREARKAEIEEEMGETGVAEPREEPRAAAGLHSLSDLEMQSF